MGMNCSVLQAMLQNVFFVTYLFGEMFSDISAKHEQHNLVFVMSCILEFKAISHAFLTIQYFTSFTSLKL